MNSDPALQTVQCRPARLAQCRKFHLVTVAACVMLLGGLRAYAQLSTEDHVAEPGFWPTRGQDSTAVFAGKDSCAKCHGNISRSANQTSMGLTATHADQSPLLRQYKHLSFDYGHDTFRVDTPATPSGSLSNYQVTDGKETLSAPLQWVFGTGRVGQSYLFKKPDGGFYEARVTFYQSLKNIGFTPARELAETADLVSAMGRRVDTPELIRCFSCHATEVNIQGKFNEEGLRGGVTCEACHGPGAAHVTSMTSSAKAPSSSKDLAIFEPSHLSPTESVEFCGACHGSFWDVRLAHVTGPSTVRSAPYRLVTSKCWGKEGDPRLVCTACHNPHKEVNSDISSYDAACLRCHSNSFAARQPGASPHTDSSSTASTARACPVAEEKCASCHMAQVYVPEMKNTFTDHRIRVVKAGEPFKD